MADLQLIWKGRSGQEYTFFIHPIGTAYKAVPGVYLFCRHENGVYKALYVGETDNLDERLNSRLQHHNAWTRCRANGATHIGTMLVTGGLKSRLNIETDLRHGVTPALNRQ